MKRYTPSRNGPKMHEHGSGMWVRYDHAKKAITDLEARVTVLQADLRRAEEVRDAAVRAATKAERERDEAVEMVRKLADRVDAAVEFIEDALEEGIEPGESRMQVEASTAVVWLSSMPSAQDDVKEARALLAKLGRGGGDSNDNQGRETT